MVNEQTVFLATEVRQDGGVLFLGGYRYTEVANSVFSQPDVVCCCRKVRGSYILIACRNDMPVASLLPSPQFTRATTFLSNAIQMTLSLAATGAFRVAASMLANL